MLEDEEETIAINYTSGTTGPPQGRHVLAKCGAWVNADGRGVETGMNFETKYLWTLPMFHCNGWLLHVGGDGGGGNARLSSGRGGGADLGPPDPRHHGHYCHAPTVPDLRGQRSEGAPPQPARSR